MPVSSTRFLTLSELIAPEAVALLVNALLLATRRMMSSGAMTYSINRDVKQPVSRLRFRGRDEPELWRVLPGKCSRRGCR